MIVLRRTLIAIGLVQIALGVVFLVPGLFQSLIGLEETPGWVDWMFVMFGARALGFGYGMLVAARNPRENQSWITAMVGVQAIDWLGTAAYLVTGTVTLAQVTTAAFLPIVFIVLLVRNRPAAEPEPVSP
jgi:hypothetical protein